MADWYAFEEIEAAWEKTYELLFPFDLGTWSRLFLIVILTGSGLNFPTSFGNFGDSSYSEDLATNASSTSADFETLQKPITGLSTAATGLNGSNLLIAFLGILFVSAVLFFVLISSLFELIYYQSLIDDNVRIRQNLREHFRKGLSYFGFRLGLGLISLILAGIMVFSFTISAVLGFLMLIGFLFLLIPLAIFLGLTNNFVLPRMVKADENIVLAWKNIYSDLKYQWRQVGVYIITRFFIGLITGLAATFWALTMLLVVGIPFGILTVIAYLIVEWLIVIPIALGLFVYLVLVILGQIPIKTYLYSYALLVFEDLAD